MSVSRTPFFAVENRLEPTAPCLFLTPFGPFGSARGGAEEPPRRARLRRFAKSRDVAAAAGKDPRFPRYDTAPSVRA